MNIKALRCGCTEGALPIDHHESGACSDPHRDPDYMHAIQSILIGDSLHAAGNVTATRTTACPVKVAISDTIPTSIDLSDYNDIYWGVAMHEFLQKYGRPGAHKEIAFPFEGQAPPTILGVPMRGRVDWVSPDTILIKDYKFHGAWAQWFAWQESMAGEVKPELSAQFSVYALALGKCLPGTKVSKAIVSHAAMTGKGARPPFDAPPWLTVEVPIISEEEIAALKPLGGRWTVRESMDMLLGFFAKHAALGPNPPVEAVEALIAAMPMVGRERGWRKKSGFTPECDYCGVRWDCERIHGMVSL